MIIIKANLVANLLFCWVSSVPFHCPTVFIIHPCKRKITFPILKFCRLLNSTRCIIFNALYGVSRLEIAEQANKRLVTHMEYCQLYFNFYCLFFPSYVNVTTWTIAYAIPHHALKISDKYKIGYGIISLQP